MVDSIKFKKAVFLDRDGVINKAKVVNGLPFPPENSKKVFFVKDIELLISSLRNLNYKLIVITNQPDVKRGKTTKSNVEAINDYIKNYLKLDDFFICYHDNNDECQCRKPMPGMLFDAAKKHNISLKKSYMIGDRWKDIKAGNVAGCKSIFIDYNYKEDNKEKADYTVNSLLEIIDIIRE